MKKHVLLFLAVLLISSCASRNSGNNKTKESCISKFHIGYGLNNPDAIVFEIAANDSLKAVLLRQEWDSLLFRGDILDTLENWDQTIKVLKADSSEMIILAAITGRLMYS